MKEQELIDCIVRAANDIREKLSIINALKEALNGNKVVISALLDEIIRLRGGSHD